MEFVRNNWYAAAWSDDIGRALVGKTFLNEPIVLYRKEDGTPNAIEDRCPHRLVPLSLGKLDGDVVECVYHGLRFNCSGECIENPCGNGFIPDRAKVRAYPLSEQWGVVWIWMGEPELANPQLIPDLHCLTDTSKYTAIRGTMQVNANHLLLMDNLTDLSHASFTHIKALESRELASEETKVSEENGVVWTRIYQKGTPVPPLLALLGDVPEKMDHWLESCSYAPGVIVTYWGYTPTGKSREEGYDTVNPHLLTPETDCSSHYLWASTRDFRLGDDELSQQIYEMAYEAFEFEDKPVLEAQQRMMGDRDLMDLQPVLLPNDAGSARSRRIVERRIAAEREARASAA